MFYKPLFLKKEPIILTDKSKQFVDFDKKKNRRVTTKMNSMSNGIGQINQ